MERDVSVAQVKQVKSRRAGREAAFVGVYEMLVGHGTAEHCIRDILNRDHFAPEIASWITMIITGVRDHGREIDDLISQHLAKGWTVERIAITDRCALAVAVFELLYDPKMPPKVSINEAVNLAKRYGVPENGKFVNGLLGKLVQKTAKANWSPAGQEVYPVDAEPEPVAEPVFETDDEKEAYEEQTMTMPWVLSTPKEQPLE